MFCRRFYSFEIRKSVALCEGRPSLGSHKPFMVFKIIDAPDHQTQRDCEKSLRAQLGNREMNLTSPAEKDRFSCTEPDRSRHSRHKHLVSKLKDQHYITSQQSPIYLEQRQKRYHTPNTPCRSALAAPKVPLTHTNRCGLRSRCCRQHREKTQESERNR